MKNVSGSSIGFVIYTSNNSPNRIMMSFFFSIIMHEVFVV